MSENKLKDLTGGLETDFKKRNLQDEAKRKTEPQKPKEPTFTEIKAQKALEEKKLILTTEIFNEDRKLEKAIKEEEQYLANKEKQAQKAIIKRELEDKAEENKRSKKIRELKGELDGIIEQFKKDWPIEKFENRFLINNIGERYKEIYYIVNSDLEKKKLFIKDYEDFNQNEELDKYFDIAVCEMLYRDYDKQDLIGLVFDENFINENVDPDYIEPENIAQVLNKYEKQKEQWDRDIDYSLKALMRNINRLTFKEQTQQLKEELREEAKHQQREEESKGKNEDLGQKIEEIKQKREEMEGLEPKKPLNQDLGFLDNEKSLSKNLDLGFLENSEFETVGDILGQIENLEQDQQKKKERQEEIEAVNDLKNKLKKKKEQRKERERQEQLALKEEEIFKYKWFEETKSQKPTKPQTKQVTELDQIKEEIKQLKIEVERLKNKKTFDFNKIIDVFKNLKFNK